VSTATFLTRWLADVVRTTTGEKTQDVYGLMVRRHINPHVGAMKLARLSPVAVQGMLGEMEREGASASLRRRAYDILRRGLQQALRWNLIPRNPCDGVVRPRVPRSEIRPLDHEQIQQLLEVACSSEDRLRALYSVALGTGLRQGELFGLRWSDIDIDGAVLHVRHQLHELGGRLWMGDVKTPRARRRVDLPQFVVEALRLHRQQMLGEGRMSREAHVARGARFH